MDPVSAVGIAAASIQFFEFVRTIIRDTNDFRQNRRPLTVENFDSSATRLHSLAGDVRHLSQAEGVSNKLIKNHDQAVEEISEECLRLSSELLQVLASLKPKCPGSKWYSFRQAIATNWKKEELLEFESRVTRCQNQLALRLLSRLEAKLDEHHATQSSQLERLQANDNKIMEVVAFTQQTLLRKSATPLREVAAVLVTLANGETRAITEKMQGTPLRQHNLIAGSDGVVSNSEPMLRLRAPTESRDIQVSLQDPSDIHSTVLKCLWFRHVSDRFEMAKSRHSETFNWIWHSSPDPEHKWSNFSEFLTSKDQIYWVNGKPGSGKTTLMKFICRAPELEDRLYAWAGNSNFIVASFFFWNLGPITLQKSQEGLLRSLLYDILRKSTTILPAIVSELYFEVLRSHSSEVNEPTLGELITWFRRLISHTSEQFRLCLIIDGLDEYTGSCMDLIDLLIGVTSSSPFVKLVVSSRPIPVCVESFQHLPGLRVQDLTYNDIHSYVEDTLGERIIQQGYEESPDYVELLNEVSEKSSGVFLWVVLVVMSLIEGLMNGDNPGELQKRLDQLPPDLEDLYRQMLDKIPAQYRRQACNIFSMVLQALEYESCRNHAYPVPALQVSFAEEDLQMPSNMSVQELSSDVQKRKCADVERRVRSRCCGLLEINNRIVEDHTGWEYFQSARKVLSLTERKGDAMFGIHPYDKSFAEHVERQMPPGRPNKTLCVEFIHRSAVEFFRTPTGASFLNEMHDSHHDPRQVLLQAQIRYLSCVGTSFILDGYKKAGNYFITVVTNFLQDVADAEKACSPFSLELIYSANAVIDHHWVAASAFVFPASASEVSFNTGDTPFIPGGNQRSKRVSFVTRVGRIKGHWSRVLILRKTTAIGVNMPLIDEFGSLGFEGLAILIPYMSFVQPYVKSKSRTGGGKDCATKLLNLWVRAKVEFEANDIAAKSLTENTPDELSTSPEHNSDGEDSIPENINSGSPSLKIQQYRDWGLSELSEGPYLRENSELIAFLLQEGADPNHSQAEDLPTTWIRFLVAIPLFQVHHERLMDPTDVDPQLSEAVGEPQHLEKAIRAFIIHGADLNAKFKLDVSDIETFYPNHRWFEHLSLSHAERTRCVNYDIMQLTAGSFIEFLVNHSSVTKIGLTVDFKSLLKERGYKMQTESRKSSVLSMSKLISKAKARWK